MLTAPMASTIAIRSDRDTDRASQAGAGMDEVPVADRTFDRNTRMIVVTEVQDDDPKQRALVTKKIRP